MIFKAKHYDAPIGEIFYASTGVPWREGCKIQKCLSGMMMYILYMNYCEN